MMAISTTIGGLSASGTFDPEAPDPNAAKKKEEEARRRKMAEMAGRKGRGSSIVTGGAGLGQESSLGGPSVLGSA